MDQQSIMMGYSVSGFAPVVYTSLDAVAADAALKVAMQPTHMSLLVAIVVPVLAGCVVFTVLYR